MPKVRPPKRLLFPAAGAANNAAFIDQVGQAVPLEAVRNVRLHTPNRDRPTGGQRPGIKKAFAQQLAGPPQGFCVIERASGQSGLQVGACETMVGTSRTSSTLDAHAFVFDSTLSMFADFLDPDAVAGGNNEAAFDCDFHPGGLKLAWVSIRNNGSSIVASLNYANTDTRTLLWNSVDIEDKDTAAGVAGTTPIYPNRVLVHEQFIFIAAGPWVYVCREDTGAFIKRYNCDGWANEVMDLGINSAGELVVLFWGTSRTTPTNPLPNSPAITVDARCSFPRSGLMKYTISTSYTEPLVRARFGDGLASNETYYESDHGYLRFSEVLERGQTGRGCLPWSMAIGPDDEIAVGFTNQGWGWNDSTKPDGSVPYTTVAMFDADGILIWEVDTNSRRDAYTVAGVTVGYCDIVMDGDPPSPPSIIQPGANAIAIDRFGDVFVGGRQNVAGFGIFKLSGDDGAILWQFNQGDFTEQHAIAVDPADNNLWVCAYRNRVWTDSEDRLAMLIKVNSLNGDPIASYDLNQATNAAAQPIYPYGIAVNDSGDVAFVTTRVNT